MSVSPYGLPWSIGEDELRRLRKLVSTCLLAILMFGLIIPWLPLPVVEREELEELPPQLARIVLDKPEPIVVAPPVPLVPEVEPKTEPEQKTVEPEPKVEPKPEPVPSVADAREKAELSGLLQFKDAFADMRDAVDVSKLNDTASLQRGAGEAARLDRSLLTSKHASRSAGVNVAALSSNTGGVALSGRETTKVEAPEGASGQRGNRERGVADPRQRSIEDIRRVFDSNKGAIFAIYNRALRKDPTLQGQVVLELLIDPSGRVVDCKVVSSELADTSVVAKLVSRIRLFDFGAKDVATTTISYPVHFLPT
jgi:outer membrane biosynthesis protein TonB